MIHSEKQIKNLPFDDQNYQLVEYPDFFIVNDSKKVSVKELGSKFAAINAFFLDYVKEFHIPCAFVKKHNKNSLMYVKYELLPFSVKILNTADKRTSKIFDIKKGTGLNLPIFEFHYGNGSSSVVSESHLISFDLCSYEDVKMINRICSKVNAVLKSYFERRNEIVGEVSCRFGRYKNKLLLADDFTPCSLKVLPNESDAKTADPYKLDKSSEMRKYTDHLFNLTSK